MGQQGSGSFGGRGLGTSTPGDGREGGVAGKANGRDRRPRRPDAVARAASYVVEQLEGRVLLTGVAGAPTVDAGLPYALALTPGQPVPAAYRVNWGDGQAPTDVATPTTSIPPHTYAQAGTYQPVVQKLDANNQVIAGADAALAFDPSFGDRGRVATSFVRPDGAPPAYNHALGLLEQPDGKVVIGGISYMWDMRADYLLARYRPDGSLDTSFGTSGKFTASFFTAAEPAGSSQVFKAALQRNGKIVVAGTAWNAQTRGKDLAAARYNPDGSLDATFGTGGVLRLDLSPAAPGGDTDDVANDIAIQPDGKILLAGSTKSTATGAIGEFAVARLTAYGEVDPTFGDGGVRRVGFAGVDAIAHGVAVTPDGKVLVGGQAGNWFALTRLRANGEVDASFDGDSNAGGRVLVALPGGYAYPQSMAVQADGRIVLGGLAYAIADAAWDYGLARFNPDGTLDRTLNVGGLVDGSGAGGAGTVRVDLGTADDWGAQVVVQADGKIVLGGQTQRGGVSQSTVVRLTPDGYRDPTFGVGGDVITDFNGIAGLTVLADGRILEAAVKNPDVVLARLRPDNAVVVTDSATRSGIAIRPHTNASTGPVLVPGLVQEFEPVVIDLDAGTSSLGVPPTRWEVDWGDGRVQSYDGSATSAVHAYSGAPNSYRVVATAFDGALRHRTQPLVVTVGLDRPRATDVAIVDDGLPAGATDGQDGGTFTWQSTAPTPFGGTSSVVSGVGTGVQQYWVENLPTPPAVNAGDVLFAHVWLDPAHVPDAVAVLWKDAGGSWSHGAYWGVPGLAAALARTDGTPALFPMGQLPGAGGWARLEVPAEVVAMAGGSLAGLKFVVNGGRAAFDRAGVNPKPAGPAAPTGVVAVAQDATQIRVEWQDAAGETKYKVMRSTNGVDFAGVGVVTGGSTSFADSGVAPGTRYWYRVDAYAGEQRARSAVASVTTPVQTAPDPQHGLWARYFDNAAATGPAVGRLEVDLDLNWGDASPVPGVRSNRTSAELTGSLAPVHAAGTQAYTFWVRAQAGVRLWVDGQLLIDHAADAAFPGDANHDGAVDFADLLALSKNYSETVTGRTWEDGDFDGDGVVGFADLLALSKNYNKYEAPAEYPGDGVAPAVVELEAGRAYDVRLQLTETTGFAAAQLLWKTPLSGASRQVVPVAQLAPVLPPAVAQAPAPPADLVVSATGPREFTLSWADRSADEAGFRVERRGDDSGAWTTVAAVGAGVTTYVDGDLRPGTTYWYRVRAYAATGAASDAAAAAAGEVTTPAAVPGGDGGVIDSVAPVLSGTIGWNSLSPNSIYLNWMSDPSDDVSYFEVSRNGTPVAYRTTPNYVDLGLAPDTSYSYSVRAFDAAGNASAPIVTPPSPPAKTLKPAPAAPAAPTGLTAAYAPGDDGDPAYGVVTVAWDAVPNATYYDVTRNGDFFARVTAPTHSVQWGPSPFVGTGPVAGTVAGTHQFVVTAVTAFTQAGATEYLRSPAAAAPPVDVAPDPTLALPDVNGAPDQYVPPQWQEYFYRVLTPALRERFDFAPTVANGAQAVPPPALHYLDSIDKVLDLNLGTGWRSAASLMTTPEPLDFIDVNFNDHWEIDAEPAWIDHAGSTPDERIGNTSLPIQGYSGPGSPSVRSLTLLFHDVNGDGRVARTELVETDPTRIRAVEMGGQAGDLLFHAAFGGDDTTPPRVIWKDVNPNGVFDAADEVVLDDSVTLTAANAAAGTVRGRRGLAFHDANGNGEWDRGAAGQAELIWVDGRLPPVHSSDPLPGTWPWYNKGLFRYASDPAGVLAGLYWQDRAHTRPGPRPRDHFREDLWTFYQAIEYIAPSFAVSDPNADRWSAPALLDAVAGAVPAIAGQATVGSVDTAAGPLKTMTFSGTHFLADVRPGDLISIGAAGHAVRVLEVQNDTSIGFEWVTRELPPIDLGTYALAVHSWTRVAAYEGDGLSLSAVRGMFLPNGMLSRKNVEELHAALELLSIPATSRTLLETPRPTPAPLSPPAADVPDGDLIPTTELDYRNVVPDSDLDGLVEVAYDPSTLTGQTGSIAFEPGRRAPMVYLPVETGDWGGLPVHEYLSQGGFAAADGQPPLLSVGGVNLPASADERGVSFASSLATRLRVNLLLNDGVNHVKRLEVVRPRGNAVVFDFKWDPSRGRFEDVGTPIGWDEDDPTTGRDATRLYVLRKGAATPNRGTYDLLFPSGVVHTYSGPIEGQAAGGSLTSVWRVDQPYSDSLQRAGGGVAGTPATGRLANVYSMGSTPNPFDVRMVWAGGRLDSIEYATPTHYEAGGGRTLVTKLEYAAGQTGPGAPIVALVKADGDGTPLPAASYRYAAGAGPDAITSGAVTWTRTGVTGPTAGQVTVTRTVQGVAGSTAVATTLNAALIVARRDVTLDNGVDPASTATTTYGYLAEPGAYDDRYPNKVPRWGKLASVSHADGSWERFAYRTADGWVEKRLTPFGASPVTQGDESQLRVETYDYAEPDGEAPDGPNAAMPWMYVERPRTIVTRTLGIETARTYAKYKAARSTAEPAETVVRRAPTLGAPWDGSAALEVRTTSAGDSPAGPLFTTRTPTGTFSRTLVRYDWNYIVTTAETGPDRRTVTRRMTETFNAFGTLIGSQTVETELTPTQRTVTLAKSTSTASVFGFGRLAAWKDTLTGLETKYEDASNPQGWFGPSQVTGDDGAVSALAYTAWGAVSNRATFGVTTAYGYDAAGNVVDQTDGAGGKSLHAAVRYDVLGRPVYGEDSAGRPTRTAYVTAGGATTVTSTLPDNETVVTTSYVDGTPVATSGTAVYAAAYDSGVDPAKGYWVRTAANGGQDWGTTYFNMLGQAYRTERSGPNGAANVMAATTEFDAFGRPAKYTDFDGTVRLTGYDAARGNASVDVLDMNANGKFEPGVDRATSTRLWTDPRTDSDPTGAPNGVHLAQMTRVLGGGGAADTVIVDEASVDGLRTFSASNGMTTSTVYTPQAGPGEGLLTTFHPDGTRTRAEYEQGLLKRVARLGTDGSTTTSQEYGYDPLRRGTSSASLFGTGTLVTSWAYDDQGQLQSVSLPGRTGAYTAYDRWSRDGTPTGVQRPDGQVFHQEFDARGEVERVYGAGTFAQKFGYDAVGNVDALTTFEGGAASLNADEPGDTTSWAYNPYTGQFGSKAYPGEVDSVVDRYKDNGLLDKSAAGGNAGTAAYNPAGETDGWTLSDLARRVVERDAKGRVLGVSQAGTAPGSADDVAVGRRVEYDANDNLAGESIGHVPDAKVRYEYYRADETAGTASPGALKRVVLERDGAELWSQEYLYDPVTKRLGSVVSGGKTFAYAYKAGTDLVEKLGSAGVVDSTREYESTTGRLAALSNNRAGGGTSLYVTSYRYDLNDQRERATVVREAPDGTRSTFYWKYEYDAANADQLKTAKAYEVDHDGDDTNDVAVSGGQFAYAFDGIGNRTDRAYAPNAANQYTANPDAGGATITYDARGNMTNDGRTTYAYDGADRLTSAGPLVPVAGSQRMEAGYDDQGRRIWKRSYQYDGQQWQLTSYRKFVYDGWNVVAEFEQDPVTGLDKLFRTYAWGQDLGGGVGGLLSVTTYEADGAMPDETYLPMFDGSGNVVGLVDAASGDVVATYEYDPFGNLLATQGSAAAVDANPFRFSTKYFDAESGLYYYGYRYYSPQLGRWTSRDPLQEAGGVNVYAFVGNDPINRVDPDGLEPREVQYAAVPRCISCHWTGVAEGVTRVRDLPPNYQVSIMRWTRTTGAIDAEVAVNGLRGNPAVAFTTTLTQQLYKTAGERTLTFVASLPAGLKSAIETAFKVAVFDVPHSLGAWSEQTYRDGSGLLPYFQRHADARTTPVAEELRQFGRALVSSDPDTQGNAWYIVGTGFIAPAVLGELVPSRFGRPVSVVSVPRSALAEAEGFVGPTIGRSGYRTMAEFDAAVGAKYQQLADLGYAQTMKRVGQGLVENDPMVIGSKVDVYARQGMRDWLRSVEGIQEGPERIIQINRRLYNPAGSGYRIPDVYIPGARSVYDATIAEKTISLPQTIDFRAFSGGGNVTIVRPSTLVTPNAQGSYGLYFP